MKNSITLNGRLLVLSVAPTEVYRDPDYVYMRKGTPHASLMTPVLLQRLHDVISYAVLLCHTSSWYFERLAVSLPVILF